MPNKIIIVDKNDRVIGAKDRAEVTEDDIYRVSALWLTNSSGGILLARRHKNKSHDPGKWGPAVAGTVEIGETYEDNIYKEAREELGLREVNFQIGPKMEVTEPHHFFCQWYFYKTDRKVQAFEVQAEEVSDVQWFEKEIAYQEINTHPERFINYMKMYLEKFK